MIKTYKSVLFVALMLSIIMLVSCKGATDRAVEKKRITSTHEVAGDIAEAIGGSFVTVTTIISRGSDPHNFKPGESDIIKVADADIVLYNGYFLEGRLAEVLSISDKASTTIPAMAGVDKDSLIKNSNAHYKYNPHFWHDVKLYGKSVESVTDKLVISNPENEVVYRKNEDDYLLKLSVAEKEIEDILSKIPQEKRKLATMHNAFEYFGKAYKFDTISLIGVDTTEEILPADIEKFVNYITSNNITVIFTETATSDRMLEYIVNALNEKNYKYNVAGPLYSDTLVPEIKNKYYNDRYIETMIYNAKTITDALLK